MILVVGSTGSVGNRIVRELLASGEQHVCPVAGLNDGALFVVDALVEGREAQLAVDTGALRTDLLAGAEAARPLLSRSVAAEPSYTAGGEVRSRRVPTAKVIVGSVERVVELGIVPGEPISGCPRDGHLALDVLRSCVMAINPYSFAAWCD